jgi:hypothetical protein
VTRFDTMNKLLCIAATSAGMLGVLFILTGNVMSIYAQSQANTTSNTSSSSGNTTKPLGSAEQLTKVLGNNTSALKNNTNIGNPNSTTIQGMGKESNTTMSHNK